VHASLKVKDDLVKAKLWLGRGMEIWSCATRALALDFSL